MSLIYKDREEVNFMKNLHMVTVVLVWVGALNWGLVGLFNLNLVSALLGEGTLLSQTVYVLVGAAAVYELAVHKTICKMCGKGGKK